MVGEILQQMRANVQARREARWGQGTSYNSGMDVAQEQRVYAPSTNFPEPTPPTQNQNQSLTATYQDTIEMSRRFGSTAGSTISYININGIPCKVYTKNVEGAEIKFYQQNQYNLPEINELNRQTLQNLPQTPQPSASVQVTEERQSRSSANEVPQPVPPQPTVVQSVSRGTTQSEAPTQPAETQSSLDKILGSVQKAARGVTERILSQDSTQEPTVEPTPPVPQSEETYNQSQHLRAPVSLQDNGAYNQVQGTYQDYGTYYQTQPAYVRPGPFGRRRFYGGQAYYPQQQYYGGYAYQQGMSNINDVVGRGYGAFRNARAWENVVANRYGVVNDVATRVYSAGRWIGAAENIVGSLRFW